MVQVPLFVKVTIPPATVHTGGVVVVVGVVKTTARPEVAVASRSIGATPKLTFVVAVEGEVTVMVWATAATPDTGTVPVWISAALVAVRVVL